MAQEQAQAVEFEIDRANLYREESFTDLKGATIRRLKPVNPDGTDDKGRKTVFVGQASLMTPNGPIPLQTLIPAKQLPQAIKQFPEAMQGAMQRLAAEIEKLKQEKESRIIVPGR